MNLDDLDFFKKIDTLDMLSEIDHLPDQLALAYELGLQHDLPGWKDIKQVVIAGMGGSAIGADLLASYCAPLAPIPVYVHRDYGLPFFARGAETLVVCSSHSGDTEETLDAFDEACKAECRVLAVSTGGELAKRARENHIPVWTFEHAGQPRAAVGFSFGLLLAMLQRLECIPDQKEALDDALASMKQSQERIRVEIPTVKNPAKRYAGQLMGRWVTIVASGVLSAVARRWKGQLNEITKAGANFEILPEADHNTLAGTMHPQEVLNPHTMTLFLRAPSDHPRNRLRSDLTRKAFMLEGMNTDFVNARGRTPLAQMWTMILFGDYVAYYLAMGYGVDPTPVEVLEDFKRSMAEAE